MVTTDSIHALKKQLTAANKASDAQTCVDVLMRLESEVEATTELLKETLIGAAVNKVAREPCSTDVANLASRLVTKWKDAVGATSSKAAKSGSTAGSPPLPPSPVSPSSPDPAASPRKNSDGYFPPLPSSSTAPQASTSRVPPARATLVTRTSSKRPPPSHSAKPAVEPASKRLKQDSGASRSSSKDGTPAPPPKEEKKKADPPRTHKTDHVDLAAAFSPGRKKKKDDPEAKVTAARVASCNALYDALACDSKAADVSPLARNERNHHLPVARDRARRLVRLPATGGQRGPLADRGVQDQAALPNHDAQERAVSRLPRADRPRRARRGDARGDEADRLPHGRAQGSRREGTAREPAKRADQRARRRRGHPQQGAVAAWRALVAHGRGGRNA